MWIKIVLVAEIVFTVGQVRSDATQFSRACYGTAGLSCTKHKLVCNKQHAKIAIEDAYFTEDKKCPDVGISTCGNIADNIADDSQHRRFNSTQMKILYEDCSAQKKCSSRAPRIGAGQISTFSIVKYQCIANHSTIRMCNGPPITGCDISLFFASLETACTCLIRMEKSVPSGRLDFYLLDMSLTTTPCTNLSIYIDGKEVIYNCKQPFTSYMHLANGTPQTNDTTGITIDASEKVWIQIKGSKSFTVTCSSDGSATPEPGPTNDSETCFNYHTTPQTEQKTTTEIDAGFGAEGNTGEVAGGINTGAVAGGIIAALLVIIVVVLVFLWFKYKRNHKAKPTLFNGKSPDENYSIATTMPVHKYHEIEAKKVNKSTDDYATVGVKNTGMKRSKIEEDYDIIDENQPNKGVHYDTTFLSAKSHINNSFAQNEDDYNHLEDNGITKTIENGIHPVGYDTAASACKSVQQIRNKGVSDVGSDCDYYHIDNNPKPKPLQSDYDTTASASKGVAKMIETKEKTEDDYDHFRPTEAGSQAADSPYDTAVHQAEHSGDYSIAGALQKHDPYDLAK